MPRCGSGNSQAAVYAAGTLQTRGHLWNATVAPISTTSKALVRITANGPQVTCDVHLSLYRGGIGCAHGSASSGWLSLRVWFQWGDPESRGRAAIFLRLFHYLILPWKIHRGCISPKT